jgi:hypothetical protein
LFGGSRCNAADCRFRHSKLATICRSFSVRATYYDALISGDGYPNWSARGKFRLWQHRHSFLSAARLLRFGIRLNFGGQLVRRGVADFYFLDVVKLRRRLFWARWWLSPKESALAAVFTPFFHIT